MSGRLIQPVLQGASLVAEMRQHRASADLSIWWLGQSGFVCASGGDLMVFDPYLSDSLTAKYATTDKPHVRMTERVMSPTELRDAGPSVVTATHQHTDHLDAETLKPLLAASNARLLAPRAWEKMASERSGIADLLLIDAGETLSAGGITFAAVPAAHDQLAKDEAGRHLYLGYILRLGGWTVYHSGDTVVYDGMAELLRPHRIDVAILPINGKVGNMNGGDAARLAKGIGAKWVIPCHYDLFEFNTADPAEEFVPDCERIGQSYRVLQAGERFTLPANLRS